MKVRFAVSVGAGSDLSSFGSTVRAVEDHGFDTAWLSDLPTRQAVDPLLGVAFAAAATSRIHLGVNLIPFGTAPYLVAHRLAQADRLCGGRLLVTLVPGLDDVAEREAVGTAGRHRGRMMDELVPQLRNWWSGRGDPPLPVRPVQEPLEIWLGGAGPEAVERAGRLSDGWLGAFLGPSEAGAVCREIKEAAAAHGRAIDPEHFGLSIGYSRDGAVDLPALRPRRGSITDPSELVPVGAAGLARLVERLVDEGLSKFVLRPLGPLSSWEEELDWLAPVVLPLQS